MTDVIPVTIVPRTPTKPLDTVPMDHHTARPLPTRAPTAPLRDAPSETSTPAQPTKRRRSAAPKSEVSVMITAFEKAIRILSVPSDILSDDDKLVKVQEALAPFRDALLPAPVVVEAPVVAVKVRKPRVKVTDPVKLEAMRAVAAKARAARAAKLAAAAAAAAASTATA